MIASEHEVTPEIPQSVNVYDDQPTSKMVNDLLQRWKRARRRFDAEWHSNYEFIFGGKQWNIDRPAWRFSEVSNMIWANVMTEVGIQTDSRPKTEFIAAEPSDFQFAKVIQDINEQNWIKYPWLMRVTEIITQSKWVHAAHAYVGWDPELANGLGDVCFEIFDPFYCYPDPLATDITDARGFIYAAPVATGRLKGKYPQFADHIKPDIETFDMTQGWRTSPDVDRFTIWGAKNYRSLRHGDRFGGEPMTMLIRAWLKDDVTETYENEKEDGTKEYVIQKKFPHGRYIEMVGNTILKDDDLEYEDGEIPIARLVNYSYPREYWGETEVANLRGPQRAANYVWSFVLDQMKMGSNPKVILDKKAGIDPENFSQEPGIIIEANDVNAVRFEPGLPIPAGMQFIIDQAFNLIDKVSGIQDVVRGATDPSVTSGLMFEGYVEAAQIRPRLKNRNLDQFLQRVGQLMLSRYLQYYTAPRIFRMTNEQGMPQYVEFFISQDEAGNRMANVTPHQVMPDGQSQPGDMMQSPVKGVPDVKIVTGSSLPFAKAQKTKSAMDLFAEHAIDQEELLKSIDWPNYQEVLQRMAKAAQEQAQMQANQPKPMRKVA